MTARRPAGSNIDAAMTRRVAGRRGEPQRIVKLKIIIYQQCLASGDHRFAVVSPHIAGGRLAALRRFLPRGVFALMEHVLRIWKSRHPAAVAKHGVPAAMIDVQVRAKHIIDLVEGKPGVAESVEPRLLGEVHRRCIALVFARAGVHQDGVFRCEAIFPTLPLRS
jgi:hypothetical protein